MDIFLDDVVDAAAQFLQRPLDGDECTFYCAVRQMSQHSHPTHLKKSNKVDL